MAAIPAMQNRAELRQPWGITVKYIPDDITVGGGFRPFTSDALITFLEL
jgi:hypothetical protein